MHYIQQIYCTIFGDRWQETTCYFYTHFSNKRRMI
uniref:Uncharacterized protein n=1 Tax=Siphoviridae sp. ctWDo30 TaxID=2826360 RepID=A0A8S5N4U6_9CAUD|nr:MAG TPA: hypothetical protein [Siphoviridae sp. ctWDo30]